MQHITLPKWVAAHGGWEWDGFVDALARHATKLGEHYGDLVDNWCTINEPNAIFTVAYVIGRWAPGVTDTARGMQVYARTLDAHAAVAKALRATDTVAARGPGHPAAFIGLAHNMVVQQPASSSPLDLLSTSYGDDVVNEMILRGAAYRKHRRVDARTGDRSLQPGPQGLVRLHRAQLLPAHLCAGRSNWGIAVRSFTPAGDWQTGLGWSIDVEGLYDTLKRCAKYGLPVLVTENGAATDDDNLRQQYLRAHIYALERAIADGSTCAATTTGPWPTTSNSTTGSTRSVGSSRSIRTTRHSPASREARLRRFERSPEAWGGPPATCCHRKLGAFYRRRAEASSTRTLETNRWGETVVSAARPSSQDRPPYSRPRISPSVAAPASSPRG